jgi:hypothetical protein
VRRHRQAACSASRLTPSILETPQRRLCVQKNRDLSSSKLTVRSSRSADLKPSGMRPHSHTGINSETKVKDSPTAAAAMRPASLHTSGLVSHACRAVSASRWRVYLCKAPRSVRSSTCVAYNGRLSCSTRALCEATAQMYLWLNPARLLASWERIL